MTQIKRAKAILRNLHALNARKYVGDLDAICTLVDLERAIAKAELTARQLEALRLVYGEDLTQKSAGERMGIARNTVAECCDRGIVRIDEIYTYWANLDGENTEEEFTLMNDQKRLRSEYDRKEIIDSEHSHTNDDAGCIVRSFRNGSWAVYIQFIEETLDGLRIYSVGTTLNGHEYEEPYEVIGFENAVDLYEEIKGDISY